MGRVKYTLAPDVCQAIEAILESGILSYIPKGLVNCVRSRGARTLAIARIYGMPKPWIIVLGHNPGYIIEVVHERFDPLPAEDKIKVLIHELLHIPYTLSGGLRAHGKLVNERRVRYLFMKLKSTPHYREALRALTRPATNP